MFFMKYILIIFWPPPTSPRSLHLPAPDFIVSVSLSPSLKINNKKKIKTNKQKQKTSKTRQIAKQKAHKNHGVWFVFLNLGMGPVLICM